jgi:hypothetical protein
MPAAANANAKDKDGKEIPDSSPLRRMAQRVARNREVLGVHYPSDSKAGEVLAERSFAILKNCASVKELIAEARVEWGQSADGSPGLSEVKGKPAGAAKRKTGK